MSLVLSSMVLAALQVPVAQAPSPWPLLERAAKLYRAATSLNAEFVQVIDNEMIGQFESRGELWQAGESRLSMRFQDPPDEAIIADGHHLWVYTPSTAPRQVLRISLAQTPTYGVNVMSWILDRPRQRYEATYLRSEEIDGHGVDAIELDPIDQTLPFTKAVVWLDRNTALPRRVELAERNGTIRTITLTDPRLNRPLPTKIFRFDIPDGVRVIDQ
jgi:outer membrane lipoprotein-sorting protein